MITNNFFILLSRDNLDNDAFEASLEDHFAQFNEKDGSFLGPLTYYLRILEQTNSFLFRYMSEEKRLQCLRDLEISFRLLQKQQEYELNHQKTENFENYKKDIEQCSRFIEELKTGRQQEPVGPNHHQNFSYTKRIIQNMNLLNEKRLYWVWGSSLLKTIMNLIPLDFFNINQASHNIRVIDPYTGCLSWSLYYFRFALNFFLLLKHTFELPWTTMSDEEASLDWKKRFWIQFDQRKFTLLNDFFWATANLLCYFRLYGGGLLGTCGDVLTLVLLVFDISIAVWDFSEQSRQYENELAEYDRNIADKELELQSPTRDNQLQALKRARKDCIRSWDDKKKSLINSLVYAVGLMLTFFLLTLPFIPIAAPLSVAITAAGAVLCFALTVINNVLKEGITLSNTERSIEDSNADYRIKRKEFKRLLRNNSDLHDNEKKLLYLEIKQTRINTKYQEETLVLQTMHLIRTTILQSITPALIFVSLVFLPTGIGLASLAAMLALAALSNELINKVFTTKKGLLIAFPEEEYEAFCRNPDCLDKPHRRRPTFFGAPGFEEKREVEEDFLLEMEMENLLSLDDARLIPSAAAHR